MTNKQLKNKISSWLSSNHLQQLFLERLGDKNKHLLNDFANKWVCSRKSKLEDYWDAFFPKNHSPIDVEGLCNKAYARIYPEKLKDCILREFDNTNIDVGDFYRLDIITTPGDDEIIYWNLIVD